MTISNKFLVLVFTLVIFCSTSAIAETRVILKGNWGKKSDQLGISLLAPGVMPTSPFMGIGGYDVNQAGKIYFADSVNRQIKSFFKREWRETMVNSEGLGEVCFFEDKLYVVSYKPNGFIVFDTKTEKTEKTVRVPFKSPGRITCLKKNLIAIEEINGGVWLVENEKAILHPAVAIQAIAAENFIYGLQKDLLEENFQIIRAEISEQVQEPEVISLLQPETKLVFARLAGIIGNDPVTMTVEATKPDRLIFTRIGKENQHISLPIFDGPYLVSSWKLCSDGNLYGFSGDAVQGFKIFASEKNFRP